VCLPADAQNLKEKWEKKLSKAKNAKGKQNDKN
jgi:hypothetical protein